MRKKQEKELKKYSTVEKSKEMDIIKELPKDMNESGVDMN